MNEITAHAEIKYELCGLTFEDMEFGRKFEEAINKNYKPVEAAT